MMRPRLSPYTQTGVRVFTHKFVMVLEILKKTGTVVLPHNWDVWF